MKNHIFKTEQVKVNDLKPSQYNPRKWSETALNQLKQSIEKFGVVDPIICNCAPKGRASLSEAT